MRYRERNINSSNGSFTRTTYNCNGSQSGTPGYTYLATETFERMWDVLTPNYHSAVRRGSILPVNDLVHERLSFYSTPGTLDYYKVSCGSPTKGGGSGPTSFSGLPMLEYQPPQLSSWVTEMAPQLGKEATARAKSPDFDFLTFVAELNKTVRLFSEAAYRFDTAAWRLARAAKHRSKGSGNEALDVFSQLWLEGRYGWRLAYLDALSILEAVQNSGLLYSRGWAQGETELIDPTDATGAVKTGDLSVQVTGRYVSKVVLRVGTMYSIRVDVPNVGLNPVVTAWELLPYSFVVDWFIDVGTSLNALSIRPAFKQEVLWMTTEVDTIWEGISSGPINGNAYALSQFHPAQNTYSFWRKTRSPTAPITYVPSFDWNFSLLKLVDLIALLITSKTKLIGYLLR